MTAVDLRRRLKLEARQEGMQSMNVVVEAMDAAVSLLVDEIGDVVEADESSFGFPPEPLPRSVREMTRGVHKLNGHLLHVLDLQKACLMEEPGEAQMVQ